MKPMNVAIVILISILLFLSVSGPCLAGAGAGQPELTAAVCTPPGHTLHARITAVDQNYTMTIQVAEDGRITLSGNAVKSAPRKPVPGPSVRPVRRMVIPPLCEFSN